jgi:rhodanese-related sulfurtransferase
MTDPLASPFRAFVVIDARSAEEYDAGHIVGSKHAQTAEELAKFLPAPSGNDIGVCLHCEFPSRRAPELAEKFRQRDREGAFGDKSIVAYPQLYLLDGGFAEFFKQFPALCRGGYLKEEGCRRPLRRSLLPPAVTCRQLTRSASAPDKPVLIEGDPFERINTLRIRAKPK